MHLIFASFALAIRLQSLVIAVASSSWPLGMRVLQFAGRAQRFLSGKPLMQYVHLAWIMLFWALIFDSLVFGLLMGSFNRSALAALFGIAQLVRWRAQTVSDFASLLQTVLNRLPVMIARPLQRFLLA